MAFFGFEIYGDLVDQKIERLDAAEAPAFVKAITAGFELFDQRWRDVVGRGCHDNAVEGCLLGPAVVAVANVQLDILVAERSQALARSNPQRLDDLQSMAKEARLRERDGAKRRERRPRGVPSGPSLLAARSEQVREQCPDVEFSALDTMKRMVGTDSSP